MFGSSAKKHHRQESSVVLSFSLDNGPLEASAGVAGNTFDAKDRHNSSVNDFNYA